MVIWKQTVSLLVKSREYRTRRFSRIEFQRLSFFLSTTTVQETCTFLLATGSLSTQLLLYSSFAFALLSLSRILPPLARRLLLHYWRLNHGRNLSQIHFSGHALCSCRPFFSTHHWCGGLAFAACFGPCFELCPLGSFYFPFPSFLACGGRFSCSPSS